MYSSTVSLTLALDVGGWSTTRTGRFSLENKIRYPLHRRLDEAPGSVWTGAENLALIGI
jgi:hypothetical protein